MGEAEGIPDAQLSTIVPDEYRGDYLLDSACSSIVM